MFGSPVSPDSAPLPERLFDCDDGFDLDRDPGRERAHADRRTRVPACIPNDLDEEIQPPLTTFG